MKKYNMEDKQKKYLDKVVELLVKNTKIDYDREEITYPFLSRPSRRLVRLLSRMTLPFPHFSTYVRDMYGLTKEEIEYVWNEYKKNIKDKIENGR